MKAEIISVGTELTFGDTLNTNAHYITQKLTEKGIDVLFHTTVIDSEKLLRDVLDISLKRTDLIIFTGGLGPTDDDMTKEIVADSLGLELVLNQVVKEDIENYFLESNRTMPENNIKQALLPETCKALPNEVGTAPGIYIEWQDKIIILLPGPPREMQTMFDKYALPLLKQENIIKIRTLNTIGIGESQLEMDLKDIIREWENPSLTTFAKEGRVDIKLVAKGKDEIKLNKDLDKITAIIKEKVSSYIYSYDNIPIENIVYSKLKERGMRIAFCESCTGGLITSKFTRIPGVSQVLDRGIISYSNQSKIEDLGVEKKLIETYGAVSGEVALAMAEGLLERSKVDIALSTTGIAGPTGGTKDKPVGLVYIGIASKNESFFFEHLFSGSRTAIQRRTCLKAFEELIKILK